MPKIEIYNDRMNPQGGMQEANATGRQFGADVGVALQNLNRSFQNAAEAYVRGEVEDDVTNVHTLMAEKRLEWFDKVNEMANSTQPGDDTLVPRVLDGIQKDFDDLSANVKTNAGKRTFAEMSSSMKSMFGQEAIAKQAHMNGEFAKNQWNVLSDNLGKLAAKDFNQVDSLVAQGHAAIDDPNGKFAKLPQATRDAFKYTLAEKVNYDAAMAYARQYPDSLLSPMKPEFRDALQKAAAFPPTPGLPPDLKADTVKPYDKDRIASVSKVVDAASPYDKTFQAAAQLYNLDWRELKMRAVVESGLDPKAISRQNAGGIMQLTPETAQFLGVNRDDPTASIFGAAKLISQYRTQAGGDMSKVDMMYYGGASEKAWGKNTKQYAANLAAVRQVAGLGTGRAPESFAENPLVAASDAAGGKSPGIGPSFIQNLPLDKQMQVYTTAEHYQRAYDVKAERARVEEQRAKGVAQEAVMDGYFNRIINPNDTNGGPLDEITVANDPTLTVSQKEGVINTIARRTRELATKQENQAHPEMFKDLMKRIYADDLDPRKINGIDEVRDAYNKNNLSTTEFERLLSHVKNSRDPAASNFRKNVNNVLQLADRTLQQNPVLKGMDMAAPGTMADVIYRFEWDLENQIAQLRKEGKDPGVLLDASPNNPHYVLRPGRIQSFMSNSTTTVRQSAANVVNTQAKTLPTYQDYDSLASGTAFTDPQGNVRVKP